MSDNPIGKDGIARVVARFKREFGVWRRWSAPHLSRWVRAPWDMHAFTNIWVEGCREVRAAYFNGHLITWLIGTNLITVVALIWRW